MLMDDFRKLEQITYDSSESALSIFFYKKSIETIISTCDDLLSKAKKIENPIKRNKLSNHYYLLKKHIESLAEEEEQKLCVLFFIYGENLYEYRLNKRECAVIEEYKLRDYMLYCDVQFKIDHFRDLFDNFTFYYAIKSGTTIKMYNEHKEKEVCGQKNPLEYIRKTCGYKGKIVVYGGLPKGIPALSGNDAIFLEKENYGRYELCEIMKREEMKENHRILQERLEDLKHEKKMDLFVFGKLKFEIKDAIESYALKELFIQKEKYEKLRSWIDHDAFNFAVYFIEKVEPGDAGDMFIQNYNGVMGIKYF